MARKTNNYKTSTEFGSLVLPVNFSRFENVRPIITAYNILRKKGRKKASFVIDAIKYYENLPYRSEELRRYQNNRRIAGKVKTRFNINERYDVLTLFETLKRTQRASLSDFRIAPKKMVLGFKIGDPEAIEIHKRLCDMSVNSRVAYITKCVNTYCEDGMDAQIENEMVWDFIFDLYHEYSEAQNKKAAMRNLLLMLGLETEPESTVPEEPVKVLKLAF